MPDPVLSATWSILSQLKDLRDTQHANIDECTRLATVIERMHNNLQIVVVSPDVDRFRPVLRKIEVFTTTCYAFLESISARGLRSTFLNEKIPLVSQRALDQFLLQHDQLHTLTDELVQELLKGFRPGRGNAPPSQPLLFGITKLRTVTATDADIALRKGETVCITFREPGPGSEPPTDPCYKVETWVKSDGGSVHFFGAPSTSLGATVASSSSGLAFDVTQPQPSYGTTESVRIAAVTSSSSGVVWANVNSINPGTGMWGPFSRPAGTLLTRDHVAALGDGTYSYKSQDYRAEVGLSQQLGGWDEDVRTLVVEGRKEEHQTYYKCLVPESGEVLAIYRHWTASCEGVLHFLGRGNRVQLRDVIVCSFAALGLTSYL